MGTLKTVLLILITIFVPPIGVFLVAGCGMDLLINILLTCLGYVPSQPYASFSSSLSLSLLLSPSLSFSLLLSPSLSTYTLIASDVTLACNSLTLRSYIPGHIHAFYLEYVFYKKRDEARAGIVSQRAAGVYSERVQRGGKRRVAMQQPVGVPAQQGYAAPQQQQGYGAI
jgi:uncharacterized membrane protein YqaE (UPF0057 family)